MIIAPHIARAVAYDSEGGLKVFDVQSKQATVLHQHLLKVRSPLRAANAHSIALAYSEDLESFYAPCYLQFWDWDLQFKKHIPLESYEPGLPVWLQNLALSPDNQWVAVASFNEQLHLLDQRTGAIRAIRQGGEYISGCTFDAQSHLLAAAHTGQGGGWISMYDVRDGRLLHLYEHLEQPDSDSPCADFADTYAETQFSPDSKRLAVYRTLIGGGSTYTLGWQGDLLMYDVATGRLLWAEKLTFDPDEALQWSKHMEHYSTYTNVAFSRNGRTVWCGTTNGIIKAYHVDTGKQKAQLQTGLNKIPYFGIDYYNRIWVANDGKIQLGGEITEDE